SWSSPPSSRLMASMAKILLSDAAKRRRTSGTRWRATMPLSCSSRSLWEKTSCPSLRRSSWPAASNAPGKETPISSRRGAQVSSISWYRASQSMTSPPRERMARRALDLPAPVPPVRPSTTRSLSASTTWKPAAFFSRLPMARPNPRLSGHWAKISVTSLVS
ncbi:NADH-quinone oxidoreductase subunit E, partial [Dysosmobacter welbionis]